MYLTLKLLDFKQELTSYPLHSLLFSYFVNEETLHRTTFRITCSTTSLGIIVPLQLWLLVNAGGFCAL